jgi:transposase
MPEAVCPPRRMRFSFESRCRIVQLVLAGESPQAAAAACGASRATGYRLWRRYQEGGWSGLRDRPSTPKRQPRRLPPEVEREILAWREELRAGPLVLAAVLERPPSTIGKVLRRLGCSRLPRPQRDPKVRYERDRPGELLHVDTKDERQGGGTGQDALCASGRTASPIRPAPTAAERSTASSAGTTADDLTARSAAGRRSAASHTCVVTTATERHYAGQGMKRLVVCGLLVAVCAASAGAAQRTAYPGKGSWADAQHGWAWNMRAPGLGGGAHFCGFRDREVESLRAHGRVLDARQRRALVSTGRAGDRGLAARIPRLRRAGRAPLLRPRPRRRRPPADAVASAGARDMRGREVSVSLRH